MSDPVNYPRGRTRIAQTPPAPNASPNNASPHPAEAQDLVLTAPEDAKVARRNRQIESAEQCALFAQINLAVRDGYPDADMILAIPNANVAGEAVGARLVREGLRAGAPDIALLSPRVLDGTRYPGAFIELKQPQGSMADMSDRQRAWQGRLNECGYKAVTCFGWREALRFVCRYLGWKDHPMYPR